MSRASSVAILLVLTASGIGATYLAHYRSAPHIAAEQRLIDSRNLLDLLPPDSYDNQPIEHPLRLDNTQLSNSALLGGYLATKTGKPDIFLLRSETVGYAGTLDLLIAIDANGKLVGIKTLRQSETPGLGARVGEWPNAWFEQFVGTSTSEPANAGWALKKDQGQFDQIAGATITSRAVINAIHDALRYFDEHRQQLSGNRPHE